MSLVTSGITLEIVPIPDTETSEIYMWVGQEFIKVLHTMPTTDADSAARYTRDRLRNALGIDVSVVTRPPEPRPPDMQRLPF